MLLLLEIMLGNDPGNCVAFAAGNSAPSIANGNLIKLVLSGMMLFRQCKSLAKDLNHLIHDVTFSNSPCSLSSHTPGDISRPTSTALLVETTSSLRGGRWLGEKNDMWRMLVEREE